MTTDVGRQKRAGAAMLGILYWSKTPVTKSAALDLVYLADNLKAEHLGEAITGCEYMRTDDGPRCADGLAERAFDELVELDLGLKKISGGVVEWRDDPLPDSYWLAAPEMAWQVAQACLDKGDGAFLRDVAQRYGHIHDETQINACARETDAYRRAAEGEAMELRESDNVIAMQEWMEAQPWYEEAQEGLRRGLADIEAGRVRSHQDVMRSLGVES